MASKWSLLPPIPPPSEKIRILASSIEKRGQVESGSSKAYLGLHALKIHVSIGFYWNSFLFWKGMGKWWAEALSSRSSSTEKRGGGSRVRFPSGSSKTSQRNAQHLPRPQDAFSTSMEKQAKYTPRKEIQQVLSSPYSTPSPRPGTGNAGINWHSRRPRKVTAWDKSPSLPPLWAFKSWIAGTLIYVGDKWWISFPAVISSLPKHIWALCWVLGAHREEDRVLVDLIVHHHDNPAFGEHPKAGSTPPEKILADL